MWLCIGRVEATCQELPGYEGEGETGNRDDGTDENGRREATAGHGHKRDRKVQGESKCLAFTPLCPTSRDLSSS